MHRLLASVILCATLLFSLAVYAATPDPEFTAAMDTYIEAKKAEFLDRISSSGQVPTPEQEAAAWCRAVMWWKMAHPDGEKKLTLEGLIELRQLEVMCGQRMRRATVLPTERQAPPATRADSNSGTGIIDVNDGHEDDNDGTRQAHEDYMRWHPEEYKDATTWEEYLDEGLLWWWVIGEGAELSDAIKNPTGIIDLDEPQPGEELSEEEQAFNEAEAVEAERLRREWEASRSATNNEEVTSPDTEFGTIVPFDMGAWGSPRQPVDVGPNNEVGSGAHRRERATSTVTGIIGGAVGIGGRGRSNGPDVTRCRVRQRDQTQFDNETGDTSLDVLGHREGDTVTIFANVAQSPGAGTFQSAMLQNQHGELLAPSEVRICDLYGEWQLSVSWTRNTYRDGQQIGQESGGWTDSGPLHIPGLHPNEGDAPDGLWRRFGFSNASHGARQIAITFQLPAVQLQQDGAVFILHVTQLGTDPVTTTPFALMVEEQDEAIEFAPAP